MRLLAIDTSGSACSAALSIDGVISQRLEHAPRRHGELILSMMDDLLRAQGLAVTDLDALAFAHGPGSFTGLRIAAAVAQGTAFAAELPVIGISTLATLAQGCRRERGASRVLSAFDARMGEVYWGIYVADDQGLMRPMVDDSVCAPEAVPLAPMSGETPWFAAGDGWRAHADVLQRRVGPLLDQGLDLADADRVCESQDILPLAEDAFRRGQVVSAYAALPVYLRNRVASVPPRSEPPGPPLR
ncbi:tRNA (adenosine(37)-N6)-threonylcarbamoyltransferase complex dimerization subunit type 1 TsaB [Thiohalocapsa marina]|uniref:tRNA threonylcarbamoyladenosine biosynthesis protein TsaB n=1 Tax=Thiohalocapsa marina TaxID=424902 RepID=A0A5M8FL24_9GAMM|nr:tRNA (adenosine(37)-N6)-threonylcarbamoyltransferase complex dimerization subunit type 1 TsaB [Thiohalocapsa marina]KAA6184690.1 tRNA (adenosine(37)-N6)-threonylcarbamoyltransferase complex dimerization subunit type 1 TsaB [Thiohalocapsa marina]